MTTGKVEIMDESLVVVPAAARLELETLEGWRDHRQREIDTGRRHLTRAGPAAHQSRFVAPMPPGRASIPLVMHELWHVSRATPGCGHETAQPQNRLDAPPPSSTRPQPASTTEPEYRVLRDAHPANASRSCCCGHRSGGHAPGTEGVGPPGDRTKGSCGALPAARRDHGAEPLYEEVLAVLERNTSTTPAAAPAAGAGRTISASPPGHHHGDHRDRCATRTP